MRTTLLFFSILFFSSTIFGQYSEFKDFDTPKNTTSSLVPKGEIIKREGTTSLSQTMELPKVDKNFVVESFYNFISDYKVKSKLTVANIKSAVSNKSICVFIPELSSSNLDLTFTIDNNNLNVNFVISNNNVNKEGVISESNSFLAKFKERLALDIVNKEIDTTEKNLKKLEKQEQNILDEKAECVSKMAKAEKMQFDAKNKLIELSNSEKKNASEQRNIKAVLNQLQIKKQSISE